MTDFSFYVHDTEYDDLKFRKVKTWCQNKWPVTHNGPTWGVHYGMGGERWWFSCQEDLMMFLMVWG
jgi:hypothetical protein